MTSEELILKTVQAFYDKAKTDILIGYHFRIIEDFETHIPRIASFWDLQLLGSTKRPLSAPFDLVKLHTPLNIKRGELGRWLLLFKKTLDEQGMPEELKKSWLEKLDIFERIFLKFLGF